MWRSRRWRKILNLIDQLPRESRYVEAQLGDEDLAKVLAGMPPGEPRRLISQWTPEVEALAQVVDRLGDIAQILLAANGVKPAAIVPYLRPETAAERIETRSAKQAHLDLVARMVPTETPEEDT